MNNRMYMFCILFFWDFVITTTAAASLLQPFFQMYVCQLVSALGPPPPTILDDKPVEISATGILVDFFATYLTVSEHWGECKTLDC